MNSPGKALLIVDADEGRRRELENMLAAIGQVRVHTAPPGEWRRRIETEEAVRAVLVGPCAGTDEQIRLYEALHEERAHIPVILYGAGGAAAGLVAEAADGRFVRALDVPIQPAALSEVLAQAFRYAEEHQVGARRAELFRSLVGKSDGIRRVRQLIERVAPTDATVLILGESGTGKEVVARNLHYRSSRRSKPFIAVDCGAIPPELLESELFGQETGAAAARHGRFEEAAGGTLFLDEIGDMSLAMQAKLLRVLQERVFERVGGTSSLRADVRMIAATHRNLDHDVHERRFRDDLYYRLSVFPIVMPPLRDRAEDIPLLITEINARLRRERGGAVQLSPAAVATLQRYAWPGNVRELANLIERLTILHGHDIVDAGELPESYRAARSTVPAAETAGGGVLPLPTLPPEGVDLKEYLSNIEYGLIVQALTRTGGVVAHAAQLLGLRRTTLVEKLHKYGMRRESPGHRNTGSPTGESPPR